MPNYTYYCDVCKYTFEKFAYISDYQPKELCPQCYNAKDVSRALDEDIITIYNNVVANNNNITLKQLADRNTKRMSRDEKINKYYDQNKYKWEGEDKDLPNGMTRVTKTDKDNVMKKIEKKF